MGWLGDWIGGWLGSWFGANDDTSIPGEMSGSASMSLSARGNATAASDRPPRTSAGPLWAHDVIGRSKERPGPMRGTSRCGLTARAALTAVVDISGTARMGMATTTGQIIGVAQVRGLAHFGLQARGAGEVYLCDDDDALVLLLMGDDSW